MATEIIHKAGLFDVRQTGSTVELCLEDRSTFTSFVVASYPATTENIARLVRFANRHWDNLATVDALHKLYAA